MINVTKAYLPSRAKLNSYIDRLYETHWLTNDGEFTRELEKRLAQYLGVKHVVLVSNGTLALQVAFKALGLQGNVVTTPFSFVATASSLAWEGLAPKFADIDPISLNIDPCEIAKQIDSKTSAILGVHVYGRPCEVEKIQEIASSRNLKVVYDAAHAFGVRYRGESILNWGDVSTLSFHATKVFHTIEGGAIITPHEEVYRKIKKMINFGITGPESIECLGVNAKMNEFQAAMGLCVLDEMNHIAEERAKLSDFYNRSLPEVIRLKELPVATSNHSYYPILLQSEAQLLKIKDLLQKSGINPRRYFYPSLSKVAYLEGNVCAIAEEISARILCIPIYPGLRDDDQRRIVEIIVGNLS